jgi:hypothetical protein
MGRGRLVSSQREREARSVSESEGERVALGVESEGEGGGETERVREEPGNPKVYIFIVEDAIGPRLGLFGPRPFFRGMPFKMPASRNVLIFLGRPLIMPGSINRF